MEYNRDITVEICDESGKQFEETLTLVVREEPVKGNVLIYPNLANIDAWFTI